MAYRVFVHIVFICHTHVQLRAENVALCVRCVWQLRIRMISLTRNNGHRCWTCCSNPMIWLYVNQQFIIWKCLALYCFLLFRFQSNVIMCCFHTQYNTFVARWKFYLIVLYLCCYLSMHALMLLKFYLFEWLFISIILFDYCHVFIAHGFMHPFTPHQLELFYFLWQINPKMTCTHVSVGPPSMSMWSFPGSKTYWCRCEAKQNLANITVKSAVTFLTLISSSSCFTVSSSYLFLLFNSFWKKLLGALLPLTGLQCGTEWLYPRPLMLSP